MASTKYALRWRAPGRCESQQDGEQNANLIFPELQVETEHRMTVLPRGMDLRHMEQTNAEVDVMRGDLPGVGGQSEHAAD